MGRRVHTPNAPWTRRNLVQDGYRQENPGAQTSGAGSRVPQRAAHCTRELMLRPGNPGPMQPASRKAQASGLGGPASGCKYLSVCEFHEAFECGPGFGQRRFERPWAKLSVGLIPTPNQGPQLEEKPAPRTGSRPSVASDETEKGDKRLAALKFQVLASDPLWGIVPRAALRSESPGICKLN